MKTTTRQPKVRFFTYLVTTTNLVFPVVMGADIFLKKQKAKKTKNKTTTTVALLGAKKYFWDSYPILKYRRRPPYYLSFSLLFLMAHSLMKGNTTGNTRFPEDNLVTWWKVVWPASAVQTYLQCTTTS